MVRYQCPGASSAETSPRAIALLHRYYETLAEKLIQEIEKKAISRIGTELAAVGYVHSLDLTLEPSRSTAYIGSPMCPSIQSLRDYLAELKRTIITSTARLKQPDVPAEVAKKEVIERHNAYVLYTYAGVTIGSCHRPTGGGIPDLDQIDPDGILTIIDKGLDKARLAPVADAAFSQLEVFFNYMDIRSRGNPLYGAVRCRLRAAEKADHQDPQPG